MKRFCENCNKKVDTTVKAAWETYQWRDKHYIVNTKVRFCNCCGNKMFNERLYEKTLKRIKYEYEAEKENESLYKALVESGMPIL